MRALGCICLKLNLIGSTGWPDRLFLAPGARIVFAEFKRPGERLRRNQPERVGLLQRYGFKVGVYDDAETAKRDLESSLFPSRGA